MNHHSNRNQLARRLGRRHVILQSALPRQINTNKPTVIGSFLNVPALPSATFLATSSILPRCICTHDLQGEFLVYWNALLPRFDPHTGSRFDHGPNNGYEEASFNASCELTPTLCPARLYARCVFARLKSCDVPPVLQQTANTMTTHRCLAWREANRGHSLPLQQLVRFDLTPFTSKLGSSETDVIVDSQNIREPTSASPRGFTIPQHQVPSDSAFYRPFLP